MFKTLLKKLKDKQGFFGFGGSDNEEIPLPDYFKDPDYREAQDYLSTYGTDILKGNIPDYYKGIGETGSGEFEDMLSNIQRDIMQSTSESLAKSGRARGGQLPASTSQAVGDASVLARYNDYARSLQGKQNLLSTGVGITEGVRGAGQQEGANRNAFNWNTYNAQIGERAYQDAQAAARDEQLGQFLGTGLSMGLGAASGGMSHGWQGAFAGAGDALSGGNTSFLSNLGSIAKKKPSSQSDILGFNTSRYR